MNLRQARQEALGLFGQRCVERSSVHVPLTALFAQRFARRGDAFCRRNERPRAVGFLDRLDEQRLASESGAARATA